MTDRRAAWRHIHLIAARRHLDRCWRPEASFEDTELTPVAPLQVHTISWKCYQTVTCHRPIFDYVRTHMVPSARNDQIC